MCKTYLIGVLFVIVLLVLGACAPPPAQTLLPTRAPEPEPPADESKVHFEQGNIYLEQGEWDRAITEYTKAIELNPEFAEAYADRAVARLEQLEYNLAGGNEYNFVIADCEKAVELNPLVKLDVALAKAYVRRGDYYFNRRDYDKAVADYTTAMKIDPLIKARTPADVYYERGEQHLDNQNYDHAIADFTKAIELDPSIKIESRLAEAYYGRGFQNFKYWEPDKAIADFSKAIELDPDEADYYYYRGETYYQLADYYWDAGQVSKEADSNNKAIADYTKAIELGIETATIYNRRGNCYFAIKDYHKATADYSRAIELGIERIDIVYWRVYWSRGQVHQELGNYGEALNDYRKALALSEDDWVKEQILKYIEELEAKYIIKDLAYIKASSWPYSDDADPEYDGISLWITFYDSKSEPITFEDIPVTVTIKLYGSTGQWAFSGDRELVYRDKVTIDHTGLIWATIEIPFEDIMVDQNRYSKYGAMEVKVTTPKQGSFQDSSSLVYLYAED